MAHLHLKNIGPISIVDVDLQRYNVFIGPQSSGKSTIAKMISLCSWIEKRALTTLSEDVFSTDQEFLEHVEEYHKMHDYFNPSSILDYRSENIHISYTKRELTVKLLNKTTYKRKKILYIPSDRNLVAMPRVDRLIMETNTNLRSFIFDWFEARGFYSNSHHLSILDLNMEYYFDKDAKKVSQDRIVHTNGKTYDIALSDASSGLQSITPLTLLLNYFSNQYFADYGKTTSYEKEQEQKDLLERIKQLYPIDALDHTSVDETKLAKISAEYGGDIHFVEHGKSMFNSMERRFLYDMLTKPQETNFVIEEPEQNLFPSTQAQLVNYLLRVCNETGLQHSFTLTTHSPYILTQLNILLFAGMLEKQGKTEMVKKIVEPLSIIEPNVLGVYAVQDDGTIKSIIDEETGMISQNYLDSVSEELSVKFQQLYRLLF